MKKIFLILLVLITVSGCVGVAITTNSVTEKITGTVRSIEEINNDKNLEKSIKKQLKQDVKIFAEINNMKRTGSYKITSYEGRILITGAVPDARIKNFIYNKVWEFDKVKEVINEVEVTQDEISSISDYFLSKSISNRLRFTNGIRTVNYEIVVSNKNAFVLGVAYSEDEMRKVGYVTGTTKGVKSAIMHVIVTSDARRR